MKLACAVTLVVLGTPMIVDAATMRYVNVDRVDGVYIMRSEVWFDASIEQVYGVLADWDLSTQYSSVIVESRNLEPAADGRPRYFARNKVCLLFFCMDFVRSGHLDQQPLEYIHATADPEISDFHLAKESWLFSEEDGGTAVVYFLELKPKFWIPPLIGPYIMKRKMRKSGGDAIHRIEAVAKDWHGDAE